MRGEGVLHEYRHRSNQTSDDPAPGGRKYQITIGPVLNDCGGIGFIGDLTPALVRRAEHFYIGGAMNGLVQMLFIATLDDRNGVLLVATPAHEK